MENTDKKSGRGGFRPGSGRKKGWRSPYPTKCLHWHGIGLFPDEWEKVKEKTGEESPAKAAAQVIRDAITDA